MKKLLFIGLLLFSSPAFATSVATNKCVATYTAVLKLIRIGAPYEVLMLHHKFGQTGLTQEKYERVVWELYSKVSFTVEHVDQLHENMNWITMQTPLIDACYNDWRAYGPFE